MRSASLEQLQRALRHADTPLTLFWFARIAALLVVVTASRVLKLERRAPALAGVAASSPVSPTPAPMITTS